MKKRMSKQRRRNRRLHSQQTMLFCWKGDCELHDREGSQDSERGGIQFSRTLERVVRTVTFGTAVGSVPDQSVNNSGQGAKAFVL